MSVLEAITASLVNNYGNDYRQIVLPYRFQNIKAGTLNTIKETLLANFKRTISLAEDDGFGFGTNSNVSWLILSNTVDAPVADGTSETVEEREKLFDFTIEKKYLDYFYNILVTQYEVGNRKFVNDNFELSESSDYSLLSDYPLVYFEPNSIELKIFPQFEIVWNNFLQKFVLIWYTPVLPDGSIIAYNDARLYLNSFVDCTNYLFADREDKNIILRVDAELGYDLDAIIQYSKYLQNELEFNKLPIIIKNTYNCARQWCSELIDRVISYRTLKNEYEQDKAAYSTHYFFIDEDVNLFDSTTHSYFSFDISNSYYADIIGGGASKELLYWKPNTAYKQGQCILRDLEVTIDDKTFYKKLIYKCLVNIEGQKEFAEELLEENTANNGEAGKTLVWELLSNELGEEELYIRLNYSEDFEENDFNTDDYYRFVFPRIEKKKDPVILPNGLIDFDDQIGDFILGAANSYILYPIENNNEVIGYADHYNTSSKVVCYIKKTVAKHLFFSVIIQFNPNSNGVFLTNGTFSGRQDLIKVVLGENISKVGNECFYDCKNLKHCILPGNLTSIGLRTFASCSSLVRASLPPRVTKLDGVYCGCTSLKTVVLSKYTTELGDNTFEDCENLKRIYNTDNIKTLGQGVFRNCKNLEYFYITNKITELPDNLFKNCENLIIEFQEDNFYYLGISCFENCKKLTKTINLKNVKELKEKSYKGCSKLEEITFDFSNTPINGRIIPNGFCQNCLNLRKINWVVYNEDEGEFESLKDCENTLGPTMIYENAFRNCGSLSEVRIPKTVKFIKMYAFNDCLNLRRIYVPLRYQQDDSNWQEAVDIYDERKNYDNWINHYITKVIVEE